MWFFAPPSACTRLPWALAVRCTCSAIGVEPTKLTAATSGCSSSRSTAGLSPCTRLSTPSGRPASLASSTSRRVAEGSCALGLRTKVLPQARPAAVRARRYAVGRPPRRPLRQRGAAPRGERLRRRRDRAVHLGGVRERDLARLLPRRRVRHDAVAARRPLGDPAVDEVLD